MLMPRSWSHPILPAARTFFFQTESGNWATKALRLRSNPLMLAEEFYKAREGELRSVSQQNKLVAGLTALCAVIWVLAAIHPVDRQAWILENLLVVLFGLALWLSHHRL